MQKIKPFGTASLLSEKNDVDTLEDMVSLRNSIDYNEVWTQNQMDLWVWIDGMLKSMKENES